MLLLKTIQNRNTAKPTPQKPAKCKTIQNPNTAKPTPKEPLTPYSPSLKPPIPSLSDSSPRTSLWMSLSISTSLDRKTNTRCRFQISTVLTIYNSDSILNNQQGNLKLSQIDTENRVPLTLRPPTGSFSADISMFWRRSLSFFLSRFLERSLQGFP